MKTPNKDSAYHLVLFFLSAIAVTGCTSQGQPAPEKGEPSLLTIETATVKSERANYTLNLPGEIAPFEEVKLYPRVSGFVRHIFVDRGSHVKRGQLLARLEGPEITERYVAAAAKQREVLERLQYSKQSYDRFLKASESTGAVAAIELERAKATLMSDSAAYQSLKAEMEAAKQLAAYLEIRAPFAGVIADRMVSPGALVGANGNPLSTLAQQDRLRLTLAIPEKHVHALSDSTTIKFTVSTHPNDTITAMISRSSGVLDRELRALMVEFDIGNKDGKFKGGEYISAAVAFSRSTPTLWVPSASIVDAPSGKFVLSVQDGTIHRISVKEGVKRKELTEVFGNLKAADIVAVKGSEELREGTKVSVR